MPLSDDEWVALARGLRRAAARVVPEWTDHNTHDPGVAVIELLGYALADLAFRSDRLSDEARALARTVAARATAIAAAEDTNGASASRLADGALVRPRFFPGQLLSADDLSAEQDYVRDRIDRRNRMLYGTGIVDGLAVTTDDGNGSAPQVVVAPGLAFDRFGREIFVGCATRVALPRPGAPLVVQLCWREEPTASVPTAITTTEAGEAAPPQATRVVETFAASFAATVDADAVAIARVRTVRGHWRVDPAFVAPRIRR